MGMIGDVAANAGESVVAADLFVVQFIQQPGPEGMEKFSEAGQLFRFRFRQLPVHGCNRFRKAGGGRD